MMEQDPGRETGKDLPREVAWPRTYRIVVEGRLEASWSDRLAGLKITPHPGDRSAARTVLVGPVRDRAEISGVLNTLADLRLSLLSVELVEEENR